MTSPAAVPLRSGRARLLFFAVGWAFFALGVLGVLLPLLPTTPFMLLALWAFSKSSVRFHTWLYNHRFFGPRLQDWHANRVIPWPVKYTAYFSMLASLVYTSFIADLHWAVPVVSGAVILFGIAFISRCPSYPQGSEGRAESRVAHPQRPE